MSRLEFRSDTMTLPTEAMREAMRNAEVGDDVCEEDPTVNRLQELGARKLGKEAALFVPSGTFANQCAVGVHTTPGDEVIAAEFTHLVEHETGATAALAGAQLRAFVPRGSTYPTVDDIAPRLRTERDVHFPSTGLIVLENALSDGSVMPVDEMRRIRELAHSYHIPVHLDGARIFNAALGLGVPVTEIAAQVDTISVCLSKGLGAPVGSLLVGTSAFIDLARTRRKMMGGGMRQVGVLAAPGIIALEEGPALLEEDHRRARELGRRLAELPGMKVHSDWLMTNMVYCDVEGPERNNEGLVDFLNQNDIPTYPPIPQGIRFVTSQRVSDRDVADLVDAVKQYLNS